MSKPKLIPKRHIKKCLEGTELTKQDTINLLKIKPMYIGKNSTNDDFFKYFNFKKDNSDVADYFNSYLNSLGIKRILNNQKQWWKNRHPYRKWYSNFDLGTTEWLDVAKKVEPYRYISDMYTDLSNVTQIGSLDQRIMVTGTKPYNDFNFVFVNGHEYAHGKYPFSVFGSYDFHPNSAQAEALNQNTNTEPGHDSLQKEKHADIWGLKYLLYKEGIYDSRSNKDITIDQIKELRKRYPKLRPLLQMNDEQLLFLLNHVAHTNFNKNNNIKQS